MKSEATWRRVLDATEHDAFDIERRWANGAMGLFKATTSIPSVKWHELKTCVDYAVLLEFRHSACPVDFLDELGRTAMQKCTVYPDADSSPNSHPRLQNSLDLGVWYHLVSYVDVKAPTMTHKDVVRATQFMELPLVLPTMSLSALSSTASMETLSLSSSTDSNAGNTKFPLEAGAAYIKACETMEGKSSTYYKLRDPDRVKEVLETVLRTHRDTYPKCNEESGQESHQHSSRDSKLKSKWKSKWRKLFA